MAEETMVAAETSQQAPVTADDTPQWAPGPSNNTPYKSDSSEELKWTEAILPFKEEKYGADVRTCIEMDQDLQNLTFKLRISNPEHVRRVKKEDLGKLISKLVRREQIHPEKTERGLYKIEPPEWPERVFFGDPNNPTAKGQKPSHGDLKNMAEELIRRYLEVKQLEEEIHNELTTSFGDEKLDQLLDTAIEIGEKPVLSLEIKDGSPFVPLKKNYVALKEGLKQCSISCVDDVAKQKVPALRTLVPLFVKFLFWPDGKERGIYQLDKDAIEWPRDVFLDNPNPAKGKPNKQTLGKTVSELFRRFEVTMESRQLDEEPPEDTAVEKDVLECATAVGDVLHRENAESEVAGVGFQACDEDVTHVADDVFSNIHGSPAKRPKLLYND